MHSSHRIVLPIVLASVATVAVVVPGLPRTTVAQAQSSSAAEATSRITAAAQALLAALDDAGRGKVQFPFEGPQKTRWSNLPSGIFERQGLRLGDLGAPQKIAVMHLLATALSTDGYRKVTEIMKGDEVLRTGQNGRGGGGGGRGGPAFG